jgi:hypothetical protein
MTASSFYSHRLFHCTTLRPLLSVLYVKSSVFRICGNLLKEIFSFGYTGLNFRSFVLWHDACTLEVCSHRSTEEKSIARQRLARHVSAAKDRLVCQNVAAKLTHLSAATDKHKITWPVRDGNLCSVRPAVIKGGHVIIWVSRDSVGRVFRRQFSSWAGLSVQLWSVNQRTTEAEEVTDSYIRTESVTIEERLGRICS